MIIKLNSDFRLRISIYYAMLCPQYVNESEVEQKQLVYRLRTLEILENFSSGDEALKIPFHALFVEPWTALQPHLSSESINKLIGLSGPLKLE